MVMKTELRLRPFTLGFCAGSGAGRLGVPLSNVGRQLRLADLGRPMPVFLGVAHMRTKLHGLPLRAGGAFICREQLGNGAH